MYKYAGKVHPLRQTDYAPMSEAEAKARFAYFREAESRIYLGPEVRPRNTAPLCGTYSGWSKHMRGKEKPCRACKNAQILYQREYRAKKRAA